MNTSSSTLQSVTLQTAVLMQVKEFAAANIAFSVHDITREVRSKVNSGALEIPEVEVAGASFRFDIPHTKVKALFNELWETGVFDPDFALDRQFNGTYFEFTPKAVSATPTTVPVTVNSAVNVAQPPIVPPTTATNQNDKTAIKARIQLYLINCAARTIRPTLKQVQSAIKRGNVSTGYSCDELKDIIENDFGYSVVSSQVAL